METGEAAATWLDGRLSADDRWVDGIPDDADPWIASAFHDVAVMSLTDLADAADALEIDDDAITIGSELSDQALADEPTVLDLDAWLDGHGDFESVSPDVSFVVESTEAVPRLNDPFDHPDHHGVEVEALSDAMHPLDVPADDILVAIARPGPPAVTSPIDPADEPDDSVGALPDVDDDVALMTEFDNGPTLGASLLDGTLVTDPFDSVDFGAVDAAPPEPESLPEEPGDDLLDEFGDDEAWTDD